MSTTQQPEALRLADALEGNAKTAWTREEAADELRRLHAENTMLQQVYAAARMEIESLRARSVEPAGAQQTAPSAAVASKAVLAAIRAANMQLVRTGDDEFMLVTLKRATPQADSQPAPVVDREAVIRAAVAAMPHTNPMVADDLLGGFTMHTEADDVIAIFEAGRAARAPADSVTAPQQEPVAYAIFAENGNIRLWATEPQHVQRIAAEQGLSLVKLYTAPQPVERKPLTDEQVEALITTVHFREGYELKASVRTCLAWYRLGLRDGERAHGIKGGQHVGNVD